MPSPEPFIGSAVTPQTSLAARAVLGQELRLDLWSASIGASWPPAMSATTRTAGTRPARKRSGGVKGKDFFLLGVFRRRLEYLALKRAVREQQSLFGANEVLIEDKASGTQLIQELITDGCQRGASL